MDAGIFVHTDSQETPCFNSDGSVSAADCSCNHTIEEMKDNMMVFFVLWNGTAWYNHTSTYANSLLNNALIDCSTLV